MKWVVGLLVCLLISVALMVWYQQRSSSGELINPSSGLEAATQTTPIKWQAWIPWWDQAKGLESLRSSGAVFEVVSPLWYELAATGTIEKLGSGHTPLTEYAANSGIILLPTIGNNLEGERVIAFLDDTPKHQAAIDYLITEAIDQGYAGWDLDWESLPESHALLYADFVERLAKALHERKLQLAVTVHARTGSPQDWVLARGHDYEQLSQAADEVRVMAYDYHHGKSPAGPTTPIDWLDRVIQYATAHIDEEKLVLALPLYGYDWSETGGEAVTYLEATSRIEKFGGMSNCEVALASCNGSYINDGEKHELWYENAISTQQKVKKAESAGITRFIFWRLGGEDLNLWQQLN